MKCTETKKNTLSVAEICSIIKICGKSGVSEFKYEGLHAVFGEKPTPESKQEVTAIKTPELTSEQVEAEKQYILDQEAEQKDLETAELLLTDPEKFEDMLTNDELVQNEETDGEDAQFV